jgi:hypothetical protein
MGGFMAERCSTDTATLREAVARLVDPDAHYNDIPDVRWAKTELQRRELAYQKADAIIGLFPSAQAAPEPERLRQVLGAFYKTVDVMKSARNSEAKTMNIWADDMKAVEDVMFFLEQLRDSGAPTASRGAGANTDATQPIGSPNPAQPTHGGDKGEADAWRYKCRDGSEVLMLKRLTDEQKRRGYYTGEDGEDEVDGDEAIVGPFHWAEETPLYGASQPASNASPERIAELQYEAGMYQSLYENAIERCAKVADAARESAKEYHGIEASIGADIAARRIRALLVPSTQNSPPVELAPQNSAERIPSGDAGSAGGEAVSSTPRGSEA